MRKLAFSHYPLGRSSRGRSYVKFLSKISMDLCLQPSQSRKGVDEAKRE